MKNFIVMILTIGSLSTICYGMEKKGLKKEACLITAISSASIGLGYGIYSIAALQESYALYKMWGWTPGKIWRCKGGCGSRCNYPTGCPTGKSYNMFKRGTASGIISSVALAATFSAWNQYQKLKNNKIE